MSFDGIDDVVILGNEIALADDTPWTISIWVQPDGIHSDRYLYGNTYSAGGFTRLRLHPANTYIYNDANSYASWNGVTLTASLWQLLTIVCNGLDANNLELFINTESQGTTTLADSSQTIKRLGHNGNPSGDWFGGYIAMTKIFTNRALTVLGIKNQFNQEKHLFGVW